MEPTIDPSSAGGALHIDVQTAHNDGVVTVDSATRGATRHADLTLLVDHAGEIGWNLDHPVPALLALIAPPHFRDYYEIIRLL